jgi:hypothetical protein
MQVTLDGYMVGGPGVVRSLINAGLLDGLIWL